MYPFICIRLQASIFNREKNKLDLKIKKKNTDV